MLTLLQRKQEKKKDDKRMWKRPNKAQCYLVWSNQSGTWQHGYLGKNVYKLCLVVNKRHFASLTSGVCVSIWPRPGKGSVSPSSKPYTWTEDEHWTSERRPHATRRTWAKMPPVVLDLFPSPFIKYLVDKKVQHILLSIIRMMYLNKVVNKCTRQFA